MGKVRQSMVLLLLIFGLFTEGIHNLQAGTPTINVDYSTSRQLVSPLLLGGNLVYPWLSILERDKEELKAIKGHSWRIHWSHDTRDGYRWDTHTIEPTGGIVTWLKLTLDEGNNGTVESPNKIEVAYWGNATDFKHSLAVTKTSSASNAFVERNNLNATLPIYTRFDLKIDGSTTYASDGSWNVVVAEAGAPISGINFRVGLTSDKRVSVVAYDKNRTSYSLALSDPLLTETWYSIEVMYASTGCSFWLNYNLVDRKLFDGGAKNFNKVKFGSVSSGISGVEGKIYIDRVRISTSYIGNNILPPWNNTTNGANYIAYFTFDGNLPTIDDYCQLAEEIGVTPIFQIPVSRDRAYGSSADPPYSWDKVQYWIDLVEYLNGTADIDYTTKTFDWTHSTPTDNWANLRAQRGRVKPYNIKYIEIGNEPYYDDNWTNNFAGFADKWADIAYGIKQISPNIKCGLPGYRGKNWYQTVLPRIKNKYPGVALIDWIDVHSYAKLPGHSDQEQMLWWLGSPVAIPYNGIYSNDEIIQARNAINTYLKDQPNYSSIFVDLGEFGWSLVSPYRTYHYLADAIYRASVIGNVIEKSASMARSWGFDTQQKHTYGIIGDPDGSSIGRMLTPSYYVYLLWSKYFGSQLVSSTLSDIPTSLFDTSFGTGNIYYTGYFIPYLSAWASKNSAGDKLYIMIINRHQTEDISATINIQGFGSEWYGIRAFTVNGSSVWDSNENNPNNITLRTSSAMNVKSSFSYTFKKLSVTALELTPSSGPTGLNIVIYPNPFKPSRGHSTITFTGLLSNSYIKIFTISGELVRQVKDLNSPIWSWDGKNDYGREVASGIYIYVVTNDLGLKATGKIAVIR